MVHPQISPPPTQRRQLPPSQSPPRAVERSKRDVRLGRYRPYPFWAIASSKPARRLKYPAMAVGGFICALIAWECILDLTVEVSPGSYSHPYLGQVERPGVLLHSKEGWGLTRLNSLGMRGPEPSAKQPGDYRILMLGDSYTRADEVSDGVNFSDRLQTALSADAAETSRQIQVINAGKPSNSPASYLYAADFHRQTFAPDSTVVQLTEHDFILDMNNPASEFYAQKTATGQYTVKQNEQFGNANPAAQALIERVPAAKSLMRLSVLKVGGRNLAQMLSGGDDDLPVEPLSPVAERAVEVEDADLVNWTVRQLNGKFPRLVLVFIPAMNYEDAGEVASDPRNAAIEEVLKVAAANQNVPLLDMRADFLHHYRNEGTNLRGFNNTVPGTGHLNAKGHAIIAQRLTDFYEKALHLQLSDSVQRSGSSRPAVPTFSQSTME